VKYYLYAESVSDNRRVRPSEDIHVVDREAYSSLFCYDVDIKEYLKKEGSVSGYNGNTYGKYFALDIDSSDLEGLISKMSGFLDYLEEKEVNYYLFFSGNKGFHIYIPKEYVDYPKHLSSSWNVLSHLFAKKMQSKFEELEDYIDLAVYDKVRLFRLPFSVHPKSGRKKMLLEYNGYKKDDPWKSFTRSSYKKQTILQDILGNRKIDREVTKTVFSIDSPKKHKEVDEDKGDVRKYCDFPYGEKLCIYKMLNTFGLKGERHQVALRLQSYWTEKGYTKDYVTELLKAWNNRLNDKLSEKELQNILKYYDKRYVFNCEDPVKRRYCVPSCTLFKHKDIKDSYIHIGKKYRKRFIKERDASKDLWIDLKTMFPEWDISEIKPGYTTVIAGGPGSGKTSFILNLMRFFKHINWLFFSIEMKGTHITDAWVKMMDYDLDDPQDARRMDEQMRTIVTIDQPSVRVDELRDYISLIKTKTGIQANAIVIDYLGLLSAKGSGATERMITVAKELKKLAKDMNIMIFAISQVPKATAGNGDIPIGLDGPKDSGEIVNLADILLTVWRPNSNSKYREDNVMCIGIPKNRHDKNGYVKELKFVPERHIVESNIRGVDGEEKTLDFDNDG